MAITTGDGYIASSKQLITYSKTATTTASAATLRYTTFIAAGNPTGGTLAATAAPGALYVSGSAGFPTINFSTGSGYLTRVAFSSSVLGRLELWDKIYGVSIPLTSLTTITITSPPSITGRLIGGTDYSSVRIFVEIATTMAASATTIQVNYTDQNGTSRAATVTASLSGFTAGRWVEIPLVAGSTGVQKIESVTVGGATNATGALNVILARQLWTNRINIANGGDVHGLDKTGMPQVFPTTALVMTVVSDTTSTGTQDLTLEIANL
jgi:hypothetical protein